MVSTPIRVLITIEPLCDVCRCAKNLGVIQFACVPDPSTTSGSSTTLVFKVSLVTAAKQIGCGANQVLQIVSAEVGTGRTIKVNFNTTHVSTKTLCPGRFTMHETKQHVCLRLRYVTQYTQYYDNIKNYYLPLGELNVHAACHQASHILICPCFAHVLLHMPLIVCFITCVLLSHNTTFFECRMLSRLWWRCVTAAAAGSFKTSTAPHVL